MDERAIAEALKGQFFWERTTKYGEDTTPAAAAIRQAQSKYRDKIPGKRDAGPANKDDEAQFIRLRAFVSELTGVSLNDIESRTPAKKSALAKAFLMWCICRYFPHISLTGMGVLANRHYTTVMHGRDVFNDEADFHTEFIRKTDEFMGHKQPG
jgi:hypothetical protein